MISETFEVNGEFVDAIDAWLKSTSGGLPSLTVLEALCDLKLFKLVTLMREVRAGQLITRAQLGTLAAVATIMGFDPLQVARVWTGLP